MVCTSTSIMLLPFTKADFIDFDDMQYQTALERAAQRAYYLISAPFDATPPGLGIKPECLQNDPSGILQHGYELLVGAEFLGACINFVSRANELGEYHSARREVNKLNASDFSAWKSTADYLREKALKVIKPFLSGQPSSGFMQNYNWQLLEDKYLAQYGSPYVDSLPVRI